MVDNQTFLLLSIFEKACFLEDEELSAEEFQQRFPFDIELTCRLLKLLGLVDEASGIFGFNPTKRLINIVIRNGLASPAELPDGRFISGFLDTVWELVAPEDEQHTNDQIDTAERGKDFCHQVFLVLGLLKKDKSSRIIIPSTYLPTRLMRNLILESWMKLLSKGARTTEAMLSASTDSRSKKS